MSSKHVTRGIFTALAASVALSTGSTVTAAAAEPARAPVVSAEPTVEPTVELSAGQQEVLRDLRKLGKRLAYYAEAAAAPTGPFELGSALVPNIEADLALVEDLAGSVEQGEKTRQARKVLESANPERYGKALERLERVVRVYFKLIEAAQAYQGAASPLPSGYDFEADLTIGMEDLETSAYALLATTMSTPRASFLESRALIQGARQAVERLRSHVGEIPDLVVVGPDPIELPNPTRLPWDR